MNGNIINYSSTNELNIPDSKKQNLFITNELKIVADGNLKTWNNDFEIWTNKYSEIKHYGIAFFWTYLEPEWRYLNINIKDNSKLSISTLCYRKNSEKELKGDFTGIPCNVGDTIKLTFYKCMDESKIGTLRIVVK